MIFFNAAVIITIVIVVLEAEPQSIVFEDKTASSIGKVYDTPMKAPKFYIFFKSRSH